MNPIRKKTKYTNKFSLLPLKIVTIRYNTRFSMLVQLPKTVSNDLLWNRSQNGRHTVFVGIHVRKTCTFDGRLQAGKEEEVRRSQIRSVRRVIKHSYHLLRQELAYTDSTVCRDIIVE